MAITPRAVGAWAYAASGSVTTTLPTHATGDMLLVRVAFKSSAVTTCVASTATGGWNKLGQLTGSTNSGNGSGSVNLAVFYKEAASAAETNPTITFATAVTQVGHVAISYQKDSGETWVTPYSGIGPGTEFTATTSVSATVGSQWNGAGTEATVAGDLLDYWLATSDDTTITVPSVTQTGTTLAAVVEYPATAGTDTSGADGAYDGGYRLCTAGPSGLGNRPVITATLSTSETGSVWATRLRAAAANQLVTPTTAALAATKFAPSVTASDHQLVTVPVAGGGAGYAAAVIASSPLAYYRMGEASGSVLDSIGSAHGTVTGTVTRDATGLISAGAGDDGAISFAGSGYFEAAWPASITNAWTIECWINKPAGSGWTTFFSSSDLAFSTNLTSHELYAYVEVSSVFSIQAQSGTFDLTAGVHHVVWTRSGHSSVFAMNKLYVDGVDISQDTGLNGVANPDTATTFRVGEYIDGTESFLGTVDELAIYSTALSAADVLAHYNAGIGSGGGGLVLATFIPTVTVATPTVVTPTTKALTTATFAPTVTASDNQLVTPTTVALTATKFAPTVTLSDHQSVTPTTKAAVLATFAPTVTASDHQAVTPTTKAVTLSTFAPTVTAAAHQQVIPSTTALSLQTFAPSVATTDHQAVVPTTKSLTLATFAPTVSTPQTVTPALVSLALTSFAPTVTNPDPQLVTPTTTALTVTRYAPSIGVSDAASIVPPNAALTLTTYAPTVIQPDPQLATPTTPALELHTFAPVVVATDHQRVTPTTAALVTARMVPTVTATANQSAIPSTKALTLTAYAPQVTVNNIVATVTIGLTLTTFAPSVTATTGSYAFPGFAELTLTGYAPFIDLSAFKLVTPATAVLVLTTYPPTAEQHSITPLPTPIYGFAIVATGPGAGVEGGNGGATVQPSGRGSTTVRTSGPSAKVTIR